MKAVIFLEVIEWISNIINAKIKINHWRWL